VNRRVTAAVIALATFIVFIALGLTVDQRPDADWLLTIESTWVNHSTLIAWWFTWLGYVYALVPLCIVLIVLAVRDPQTWRWRAIFAIVALILAWQGADIYQHLFARPRRLDWVVKHETAFSYPSSHAAIATAFYALLGTFAWFSPQRFRWIAVVLWVAAVGICWSRLALAAHYLTDVVGGILWGITVVALLAALVPINVFEGHSAASLE
jgi:undecaprenyl-diphosphatase